MLLLMILGAGPERADEDGQHEVREQMVHQTVGQRVDLRTHVHKRQAYTVVIFT